MDRKFPKGNNLLREHKESTLEKQEKMRQNKKQSQEEAVSGKDDMLNKKINERNKRKAKLMAEFNKFAKDIA